MAHIDPTAIFPVVILHREQVEFGLSSVLPHLTFLLALCTSSVAAAILYPLSFVDIFGRL
jgi:hypothetical protein